MRRDLFQSIQFDRNRNTLTHAHTHSHTEDSAITICSLQIATGLISVFSYGMIYSCPAYFFRVQKWTQCDMYVDWMVRFSISYGPICSVNACVRWLLYVCGFPFSCRTDSPDNYPGIYLSVCSHLQLNKWKWHHTKPETHNIIQIN